MKTISITLSLLWSFLPLLPSRATAAADPNEILRKADYFRNPQEDYTVQVKVTDHRPGSKDKTSLFKVLAKGRESSVVQTIEPPIDRGRILLMSGNDFWGYLPNVSKPIRISLQEKLTGEVANGDLSRANFAGDYEPTLAGTKVLDGKKHWVLDLKAKSEDVTYGRVKLFVETASNRPRRAEFYAFSGRLLKTCDYKNYKTMGGVSRPTVQVMTDAVKKDFYSVLEYADMVVKPLPSKYFTKQYMKRFMD